MIFHNLTNNPYAGRPNTDIDAAWDELMAPMHIRVTANELSHDHQESVALPEAGGYLGWLGAFHELHCIVRTLPSAIPTTERILSGIRELIIGSCYRRICYGDGIIAIITIPTLPVRMRSTCSHMSVSSCLFRLLVRLIPILTKSNNRSLLRNAPAICSLPCGFVANDLHLAPEKSETNVQRLGVGASLCGLVEIDELVLRTCGDCG
jgi:hypothetical protein